MAVEEVLKAQLDSPEPLVSGSVREDATIPAPNWSEEARRNVAAFFYLLDRWDRESSKIQQVA